MEQHGENPLKNVIAIIPARFASTRLAGKLLRPIAGKPLILHTLEQTARARSIARVIVATDHRDIFDAVTASGHEAVMTSPSHISGSDRVAEVAETLPKNSIIVNVQGDEPLISPRTIESAVEALLADSEADVSTTCEPIENIEEIFSPDVVKVVLDNRGRALYFSRSPIPFLRDEANRHGSLENALAAKPALLRHFRKHTGLYVYSREFILKFAGLEQAMLEKAEMLEQLRILENGGRIRVVEVKENSIGVDTFEDLERVRSIMERRENSNMRYEI